MYDITNPKTLEAVRKWKPDLDENMRKHSSAFGDFPAILLANKVWGVAHLHSSITPSTSRLAVVVRVSPCAALPTTAVLQADLIQDADGDSLVRGGHSVILHGHILSLSGSYI